MKVQLDLASAHIVQQDGCEATVTLVKHGRKPVLRLDYAFSGASFAIVRLPFKQVMPANYALTFEACGEGAVNGFDTRLVEDSESGETVWWVSRPAHRFSKDWARFDSKNRHFHMAWGPKPDKLTETSAVDMCIVAKEGGKGTVWFRDITFQELPKYYGDADVESVLATTNNRQAKKVIIPGGQLGWHSSSLRETQKLRLKFAGVRAFGSVIIYWGEDYATAYDLQARTGRGQWKTVDSVENACGYRQFHWFPEVEADSLRLVMRKSSNGRGYMVKSIQTRPLSHARNRTEYFMRVAEYTKTGYFPRHLLNQQSFWTVVGADSVAPKALINEEGMVEFDVETPSVDPFIFLNGKLLTWADAEHRHSLADGYLPIPTVVREHKNVQLSITALAEGTEGSHPTAYVRYVVKNTSKDRQAGKLFLAVRPFQVNPPWQVLTHPGGFTALNSLKWGTRGRTHLLVNDNKLTIYPLTRADGFGASVHRDGDITESLSAGKVPNAQQIEDKDGTASGAIEYSFDLAAGEEKTVDIAALYSGVGPLSSFDRSLETMQGFWRRRLAQIEVDVGGDPDIGNTIRSMVAYILINRNKHAIQPGTRCYRRSWIRDGALTGSALLQWGYKEEVERFIRWYAKFLFPNGKVPAVIDRRGADPIPEHDAPGQFIYLVAEYYRHTGDKKLVEDMYPAMLKIARYIEGLRQSRMTPEFYDKPHLYGLMPASASHEGYMARPAYSVWDDLFVAKGLADLAYLAGQLGKPEQVQIQTQANAFRLYMFSAIHYASKLHGIDYIPGATDLGDFDATSTTIGIDPTGLLADALPASMQHTFDRYWKEFQDRRDGKVVHNSYTPYEWRVVGAFVRMGKPEIAHACADWFMGHRRPSGWNHWAEVVYTDPRTPGYIGDAPHGWVGSDFMRSIRSMFAYEAKDGKKDVIVVGAGIKREWWKQGVKLRGIHTHHGVLNMELREQDNSIVVRFEDSTVNVDIKLIPPGGGPVSYHIPASSITSQKGTLECRFPFFG